MTPSGVRRKEVLGIVLAILMLASPISSAIALAAGTPGAPSSSGTTQESVTNGAMGWNAIEFSDSNVVQVRENVSVWNRAIFPLRADDSTAAHSSENIRTNVQVRDENVELPLNKPSLSVYDAGSTVELTFLPGRANAPGDTFDHGQVQFIVARVDADQEVPDSQGELTEFVTANNSATFSMEAQRAMDIHEFELNGASATGDVFSFTPEQSGQYVLFLAAPEDGKNGFEVQNGNISAAENVTVFGLDTVTVHEEPSTVDAPESVETGENATFDVNTTGTGDDVNHMVAIYNEDTFSSASNTFIFDNATASTNVEVKTGIKRVNGEVRIEDDSTILLRGTTNQKLSPSMEPSAIANTILGNRTSATVTDDAVVLNASLTAVRGPADTTVDVGVLDSWGNGTYRWIHIATTDDGSIVGSDAGDITVGPTDDQKVDEKPGDSDGDSWDDRNSWTDGDSQDHDDPPSDTDDEPSSDDGDSASVNIRTENGRTSVSINSAAANEVIELVTNAEGSGPASPTLDQLNVSFTEATDANLVVSGGRGSTPPVNEGTDLGYFNISHEVSDETINSVTFSFSVKTERLDERGVSAADVTLYRYHDGEWQALETRHVGTSGGEELFKAESPGLSVFAVSTRGAMAPAFEVTDASVGSDSVETGETVAITASVENTGEGDGTYTAELVIDGETVEQQDVTVPAGESKTVTFTHVFDEAGSYEVAVGDTAAGTVEVTAPGADTDTPTDSPTETTTTTTGPATGTPGDLIGGSSLAIVLLVLLVIAGAVAFLYRSGRLDDFN